MRPIEQRLRDGELPVNNAQRRIILVCREGYGSSLAAATLQDLGLHRATAPVGGFQALARSPNRDEP